MLEEKVKTVKENGFVGEMENGHTPPLGSIFQTAG